MEYTINIIIKACELSGVSAEDIINNLNEAADILALELEKTSRESLIGLLNAICSASGVSPERLKKRDRSRKISYIKHTFATIAYETFPKTTLEHIGECIGQHHETVIYYCKEVGRVKRKRDFYLDIKKKLNI